MADQFIMSRNPATGEEIERFPFQSSAKVDELLAQGDAAFRAWRTTKLVERAAVYSRLADVMRGLRS